MWKILARLSAGMSSKQVFHIMRKPYRSETFDVEEDHYEIWFYITNLTLLDQKTLTHKNLTPLTFKNGVLLGKGYHAYYKALSTEEAEIEAEKQPSEDNDLEKVLNAPKKQPPAKGPPTGPTKPQNSPSTPSGGGNTQQGQQRTSPSQAKKPSTPPASKPNQPSQTKPAPSEPQTKTPSTVTMSSASSSSEPPPPQPPPENTDNKKAPLTEEDQKVIQEEQEENFDFW